MSCTMFSGLGTYEVGLTRIHPTGICVACRRTALPAQLEALEVQEDPDLPALLSEVEVKVGRCLGLVVPRPLEILREIENDTASGFLAAALFSCFDACDLKWSRSCFVVRRLRMRDGWLCGVAALSDALYIQPQRHEFS